MDQMVLVTMGALKQYTVHSYDENCLDEIDIGVQGQLPPGAAMAPQKRAPSPVACQFPSAKQSVSRTLEWLAPPNYGGNVSQICFTATDVKGSCYGRAGERSGWCAGADAVEGRSEQARRRIEQRRSGTSERVLSCLLLRCGVAERAERGRGSRRESGRVGERVRGWLRN
jgi:hypothetical protein